MKTLVVKAQFLILRRLEQLPETGSRGATSAEYALIIGLVAVVIVVAVGLFGDSVLGLFSSSAAAVSSVAG